jgi:hypothetical protein
VCLVGLLLFWLWLWKKLLWEKHKIVSCDRCDFWESIPHLRVDPTCHRLYHLLPLTKGEDYRRGRRQGCSPELLPLQHAGGATGKGHSRTHAARRSYGGATTRFSNGGACMCPPTMGFARVLPRSEKLCGIRCRWSSLVPRWVAELVCSLPQWDSLGRGQGSKDSWPPARAEGGARAGEEPRLVSARMSGTNRAAALEPRGWGSCAHHRPWELGGATCTASRGCLAGLGGGPQAMGGIATGEGREKKERNRMDRFVYNQWQVVILWSKST